MDAIKKIKVWAVCFLLISAFALSFAEEDGLGKVTESRNGVTAGLFHRQRRQYFGGYPGGGFGASNSFANANAFSGGGGGPFGGFSNSGATASAGSTNFNSGFGRKK